MAQGSPRLPEGVREGEVVLGKFRIGAVLGWGSMGTVVAAHHLLLDERRAIKFLTPEAVDHPESRSRFLREAKAAASIKGAHVVEVYDVDLLPSGEPYIVMEHLTGCNLAEWLREHGPLPADQAAAFVRQACHGIGRAHERGIVHRDLKPANLFVVQRKGAPPLIKVLDFGIAKTTGLSTGDPGDSVVTAQMALIGTPPYMSPEQLGSSREVDPRSDIWALGVILFQLVTGKLPFEGTPFELGLKFASPVDLDGAGLPPGVRSVVQKCLERDPSRRYQSADELAEALATASPLASQGGANVASVSAPGALPDCPPTVSSTTRSGPSFPGTSEGPRPADAGGAAPEASSAPPPSRRGLRLATLMGTATVVAIVGAAQLENVARTRRNELPESNRNVPSTSKPEPTSPPLSLPLPPPPSGTFADAGSGDDTPPVRTHDVRPAPQPRSAPSPVPTTGARPPTTPTAASPAPADGAPAPSERSWPPDTPK